LTNETFLKLKAASVTYDYFIPKFEWASYLETIGAEEVRIGKKGVYIELVRFFVDESGLYSPLNDNVDASSLGEGPEFIHLGKSVYSYHRKG